MSARLLWLAFPLVLPAGLLDLRGDDKKAAPNEDEVLLKAAGFATDGPGLIEFFRKRTLSAQDQEQLEKLIHKLGSDSFAEREKASKALKEAGPRAIPILQKAMKGSDLEIIYRAKRCLEALQSGAWSAQSQAAARLLALRKPDGAVRAILDFLPFADDESVDDAIVLALGKLAIGNGKVDELLTKALKDGAASKRAVAAVVIGEHGGAKTRGAVRALFKDADAKVRLRAAQGLLAGRDNAAIAALVAQLADLPLPFAHEAEELLLRLAGEKAPTVSLAGASPQERKKCCDAWNAWLRDHGAKLDLAKLDLGERTLGFTLIAAIDGYNGGGKVWEIGPDGKERWGFTNVQGPTDAQVLPGNRVLVAEHAARRVTERDLKGNVLWEHKVDGNPHDCMRLRNGNTFIAVWPNECIEVDRNNKVVASWRSTHGSVTSGQKLKNNHVVYVAQNGNIVELDAAGKEVRMLQLGHAPGFRLGVEETTGGRLLVSYQGSGKVVELDKAGKEIWSCTVASATAVSRTPSGHTLICSNDRRVVSVDRNGKVVWELNIGGRPFRLRKR